MSTVPDNDLDLTVLEDLDFVPSCECRWHEPGVYPFVGAERPPATWRLVLHFPCGHVRDVLTCDECQQVAMTSDHALIRHTPGCGETHPGPHRQYLVSMVKL